MGIVRSLQHFFSLFLDQPFPRGRSTYKLALQRLSTSAESPLYFINKYLSNGHATGRFAVADVILAFMLSVGLITAWLLSSQPSQAADKRCAGGESNLQGVPG